MRRLFSIFSSIWLTVVLLSFSMLLVFAATLAQTQWGIFDVQHRFFESLGVFWQYPAQWPGADMVSWLRIPLPGGFLIGGLLIINLLCAHFRYFRPSWSKSGIALIHCGILLLIISGFSTAYFQQEFFMWINVGGSSDHLESFHDVELALVDHTAANEDTVVSIPAPLLQQSILNGKNVSNPALPFTVRPVFYYPNTAFYMLAQNPTSPKIPADKGVAVTSGMGATEKPYDYSHEESNVASAVVEIDTPSGPIGKWFVSSLFQGAQVPPFLKSQLPQTFTSDGHTWEIVMRPRREYLPISLQLDKFIHETYPGTDVASRFESQVHLVNRQTNENRPVLIYMNHPLRYAGLTFYQASFTPDNNATMLQVVRNPGWLLPYFSVAMVGFGLALHFCMTLLKHLKRERKRTETGNPAFIKPEPAHAPLP